VPRLSMKPQIKSLISKARLDIRLLKHVPFGVSWEQDVRGLLGSTAGQLTILDVGANVGQTAESLARVFPNSKIFSFEPVPTTFAKLRRNTAHLTQVECVNMALGDKSGEAVITNDRDGRNTLLSVVPSKDSVMAKVGTVGDFCADRGIHRVDLLKTDTEGFETFVLKGAGEMLAKGDINFVVSECDFFRRPDEPHGDFFEIYAILAPFGFTLVSLYTGGVDQRGWIWGNMLMMREGAIDIHRVMASPNGRL
jgi:FkbM family methyltransferase